MSEFWPESINIKSVATVHSVLHRAKSEWAEKGDRIVELCVKSNARDAEKITAANNALKQWSGETELRVGIMHCRSGRVSYIASVELTPSKYYPVTVQDLVPVKPLSGEVIDKSAIASDSVEFAKIMVRILQSGSTKAAIMNLLLSASPDP